jgi:D-3-phosphoglycerate dehydrogenase
MRKLSGYAVYAADVINQSGLDYLQKNNFELVKLYGLNNEDLILRLASENPADSAKKGILIVRTTRSLDRQAIEKIKKNTGIVMICAASSGYDNIDLKAAKSLGIRVMNVPDATYEGAAEHTLAMILALVKNLVPANRDMKSGVFDFNRFSNTELLGKSIGIIGVGRVGSKVAKLSKAFGMKVLGNDIKKSLPAKYKWIHFLPLNSLLKNADIVTVHTPLDNSTLNLLNEKNLKYLKDSAIVVNCARGGIVNEKSLTEGLKKGKIRYGAIDVFSREPGFNKEFTKLKNVLLTPHLAGKTAESKQRVSNQLAAQIHGFCNGKSSKGIIC